MMRNKVMKLVLFSGLMYLLRAKNFVYFFLMCFPQNNNEELWFSLSG